MSIRNLRHTYERMRQTVKYFSTGKTIIKRSVYVSQSNDIYTNLALEDWFYKNHDFKHHEILLLWQNQPCVVIGRHQNPWIEVNLNHMRKFGVKLARRNSGGGTVYHDAGNLNLTFFTSKKCYSRRYNLEIIARALAKDWACHVDINAKDDIVLAGKKISGTAAKLGRDNAYHHCTLLVNVEKDRLRSILSPEDLGITTNATRSLPSPICNLHDANDAINVSDLMTSIGWQWLLETTPTKTYDRVQFICDGFKLINPTAEWFPGLERIRDELSSWSWIFGKAPRFDVIKHVPIVSGKGDSKYLEIVMEVEEGKVMRVKLRFPTGVGVEEEMDVLSELRGQVFDENVVVAVMGLLTNRSQRGELTQV